MCIRDRAWAEAYLHAKFHFDPSNRLVTIHQRYRQTDRTTVRWHRANRFTNGHPKTTIPCKPYEMLLTTKNVISVLLSCITSNNLLTPSPHFNDIWYHENGCSWLVYSAYYSSGKTNVRWTVSGFSRNQYMYIYTYCSRQWWANPNHNWDLNRDVNTFGAWIWSTQRWFKRLRFDFRFRTKYSQFDLKKI